MDPGTTERQAPNWPARLRRDKARAFKNRFFEAQTRRLEKRERKAEKNLFRYCLPFFHETNEGGRYWLGQIKLTGVAWDKRIVPKTQVVSESHWLDYVSGAIFRFHAQNKIGVRQTYSGWTVFQRVNRPPRRLPLFHIKK